MRFILIILLFISFGKNLCAQDSLWVKVSNGIPVMLHKAERAETLFLVAKRYSIPPAILSDINDLSIQNSIPAGTILKIPIDRYNYITNENVANSKPIYYTIKPDDDLVKISRLFKVSQGAIQRWNSLPDTKVRSGKVLKVGWVAYEKVQQFSAQPTVRPIAPIQLDGRQSNRDSLLRKQVKTNIYKDTALEEEPPTALQLLYEQQTLGNNLTEESGAAVFYDLKMKAAKDVYYAFHNTAIRGTVLKITNPANGKVVFAKVIGSIPNLKEYHNALIGLSNNAAAVLGALDTRMFCNLKYR